MKTNKFLHYSGLWLSAVVAVTTMCIACDSDNDIEQNPSDPDQGKSEVTMTIKGNGATGTGTANDPIVVEKGNTYTMTVSQQSTYTDPNGSVTTREPKATMSLSAKLDTVVCKSLKDLTAMTTNAKTNDYGESPMQKNTIQTFNIGGQEITFDLAYEIYKIVNSQGKTIEMPYAKINNARYGKATTAETRAANVYATCIKLTQLPYTRGGIIVTDSTAYNVSVSFNLDIESVNTKDKNTQNLSFTVNYTGIVKTTTEYPAPSTTFSYNLNILGGTKDRVSPFTLTKGDVLSLEWNQAAVYTFFSKPDMEMKSISFDPKATVKLAQ